MSSRAHLFGIDIDVLDMSESVRTVFRWLDEKAFKCRYVVTPNVDHIVKLNSNPAFLAAYRGAALVVADGRPVVLASRLLGSPLPGVVPGSDLVPALFAHAQLHARPLRVFLIGAGEGVGLRAAEAIMARWPTVTIVGVLSPPMGFEHDPEECQRICGEVSHNRPDILILGLGAPKQELWVHMHQSTLQAKAALCVGATIDFLAGEKPRAPEWVRKAGLEWLHRMLSEPRRLIKRYAHDAAVFPVLLLGELIRQKTGRP